MGRVYIHTRMYVKYRPSIVRLPIHHALANMVRRTRDEALETRNRILDAAEQLFSEHGVSRTSLADIAQAAGVTRGAIYWHFRDKGELFTAMVDRVTLPMDEMVASMADTERQDPLASIRAAALYALERTTHDAQCQRVFDVVTHKCEYLHEMAAVKQRMAKMKEGCVHNAELGFRNAIKHGQLPAGVNARAAAVGLDALLHGLIVSWLANRDYFPLKRRAAELIDIYLNGLRHPPAKRSARSGRKTAARTARSTRRR